MAECPENYDDITSNTELEEEKEIGGIDSTDEEESFHWSTAKETTCEGTPGKSQATESTVPSCSGIDDSYKTASAGASSSAAVSSQDRGEGSSSTASTLDVGTLFNPYPSDVIVKLNAALERFAIEENFNETHVFITKNYEKCHATGFVMENNEKEIFYNGIRTETKIGYNVYKISNDMDIAFKYIFVDTPQWMGIELRAYGVCIGKSKIWRSKKHKKLLIDVMDSGLTSLYSICEVDFGCIKENYQIFLGRGAVTKRKTLVGDITAERKMNTLLRKSHFELKLKQALKPSHFFSVVAAILVIGEYKSRV